MKIRSCVPLILLVSSAACAPSARPADPAPRAAVPPVLALVSERERLSLTPDQVVQLEAIAREWDRTHTRLTRQRAKRPAAALPLRAEAGPLRKAIAENHARAAQAAEKVLTPEQRAAACAPAAPPRLRTVSLRAEPAPARGAWHWCRG